MNTQPLPSGHRPFSPSLFAGRRFAVVGLGRNGSPAARALSAMGAEVLGWDDSPIARDQAHDIALGDPIASGGRFDAIVLSPGIPHIGPNAHPVADWARDHDMPVLSDAELLFHAVRNSGSKARFVGITGTNGKSTTTVLLTHILTTTGISAVAGGNLGPAALVLPLLDDSGVYVLEMSSYMLERIAALRFDAAAMLNLSADHLDRHGDMAGYAAAKRAIFGRQGSEDFAACGIDDPLSAEMAASLATLQPNRVHTISGHQPADFCCLEGVLQDAEGPLFSMAEAPTLLGAHNAQNAAAAAGIALWLGVSREDVARGIRTYPGLAHRQQAVGTIAGVTFVNDSKATNADAAARSLACYPKLIWIAGGTAKAGGIEPLAPLFDRVAHAFLIGRDRGALAATLAAHDVPHTVLEMLDEAVSAAFEAARSTGAHTVLLAPACASFDQYSGFDARGAHFIELVTALAAEETA